MRLSLALGSILALFAMTVTAETLYRWVDSQGNVHFTDQPPLPRTAKKVDEITMPKRAVSDPALPYALQQAMKNHPVTVYVATKCAPCTEAQALLNKRGIPYSEKDPQKEEAAVEELKKLAGDLTVPTLVVGKAAPLKGFEVEQWNAALDAAGYPRTGVPPRPAKKPAPEPPVAQESTGGSETTPPLPIETPNRQP